MEPDAQNFVKAEDAAQAIATAKPEQAMAIYMANSQADILGQYLKQQDPEIRRLATLGTSAILNQHGITSNSEDYKEQFAKHYAEVETAIRERSSDYQSYVQGIGKELLQSISQVSADEKETAQFTADILERYDIKINAQNGQYEYDPDNKPESGLVVTQTVRSQIQER